MLVVRRIDTGAMVQSLLTRVSLLCCLLIAFSFALFTHDQLAGASQTQQRALVAGTASSAGTAAPSHGNSVRSVLDDVTHALTSPFRGLLHSSNAWVNEGIPTIIALLVYGLGLSYLGRFGRGSP